MNPPEWRKELSTPGYYWAVLTRTKAVILVEYIDDDEYGPRLVEGDIQRFMVGQFDYFAGPMEPPELPADIKGE